MQQTYAAITKTAMNSISTAQVLKFAAGIVSKITGGLEIFLLEAKILLTNLGHAVLRKNILS